MAVVILRASSYVCVVTVCMIEDGAALGVVSHRLVFIFGFVVSDFFVRLADQKRLFFVFTSFFCNSFSAFVNQN
jgi:hypothetical protein